MPGTFSGAHVEVALLARANVASSLTLIKGAMTDETYVFAAWEFARSKRENLGRLRDQNFIGASSATWLRDVAKALNRRFDPISRDRALVELAQSRCDLQERQPLLRWHMTRDKFLLRDFLRNWLSPASDSGRYRVRPEPLQRYLLGIVKRGAITEHAWTETTRTRAAASPLQIAVIFGLLCGTLAKESAHTLPERCFI